MSQPIGTRKAGAEPWTAAMRWLGPGIGQGLPTLMALCVALILVFSVLMPERFPTFSTAQSIMFQLPVLGLLALAMLFPLISGGLNLAIIATANQSALLMAAIMTHLITPDSSLAMTTAGIVLGLAAGLAQCLAVGLFAGSLIAYTGTHPILVTLGTMSLVQGISVFLTRGKVIAGLPTAFQWLGNATLEGIPVSFLVFAGVVMATTIVLQRTGFGIAVFMIGSNRQATHYSGIDTRRILVGVYALSSGLCFVAACLMLATFNSASPDYAQSYLLVTILAAVLGGVDPNGGFGRIAGLMTALLMLQIIASGLNQLGASQHVALAIWGLTLIAVMALRSAGSFFASVMAYLSHPTSK